MPAFIVGQALWCYLKFPDGAVPEYERPFLIVGVGDGYIEVLTVSSVEGKEYKLSFPTNKEIHKHNPPFPKRTFVKLDSYQKVSIKDIGSYRIGCGGKTLDEDTLELIIRNIIR